MLGLIGSIFHPIVWPGDSDSDQHLRTIQELIIHYADKKNLGALPEHLQEEVPNMLYRCHLIYTTIEAYRRELENITALHVAKKFDAFPEYHKEMAVMYGTPQQNR